MRSDLLAVAGSVLAVAAIAAGAAGLHGLAEHRRQAGPPLTATLTVACSPSGITVSGDRVAAGPAGVTLEVSSAMPAGNHLSFHAQRYGAGEQLPTGRATWTLAIPPGEVTLSCGTSRPDLSATITVEDPDGNWRDATVGDVGCALTGAQPSWAVGPGVGDTARAAVDALLTQMSAANGRSYTARDAALGYPGAATQTWVATRPDGSGFTIQVTDVLTEFEAAPDRICG